MRAVLRRAGFARAHALGGAFGECHYRLAVRQRRRLLADMAPALGRPPGDPAVAAWLREAYRRNDAAMFEVLAMFDRRHDPAVLAARCEIDGIAHLRDAMAAGRGAILLAAHAGNAALVAIALARDGWPVSVVYREARMMSAGFLQEGLAAYGIDGILANAGIRAYGRMLAALKQGRIVFMMMDQGMKNPADGVPLRFLGKDVSMPAGPAQLARAGRAPLLPLATRAAEPCWRFAIEPPVALGDGPLESDVRRLAALVEQQVRLAPQLWSWHLRRWRKAPLARA